MLKCPFAYTVMQIVRIFVRWLLDKYLTAFFFSRYNLNAVKINTKKIESNAFNLEREQFRTLLLVIVTLAYNLLRWENV